MMGFTVIIQPSPKSSIFVTAKQIQVFDNLPRASKQNSLQSLPPPNIHHPELDSIYKRATPIRSKIHRKLQAFYKQLSVPHSNRPSRSVPFSPIIFVRFILPSTLRPILHHQNPTLMLPNIHTHPKSRTYHIQHQ